MAWHKIAILGLLGCGIAAGCTVTTSDGDDDTDGGDAAGGSSNGAGGSSAGGSSAGGSSAGGSSAGGSGAGGAAPATCNPSAAPNDCQACVETKCCDEYFGCDDDTCAGTNDQIGELECFQNCMALATTDGGSIDQDTVLTCAGECAAEGGTLAENTEDVITCIRTSEVGATDGGVPGCSVECYGVDLSF